MASLNLELINIGNIKGITVINNNPIQENNFNVELITSEKKINDIKSKNNITVDNFIFRVIESDNSGFMNSDLIDGILSLSYSNISQIPNTIFIM